MKHTLSTLLLMTASFYAAQFDVVEGNPNATTSSISTQNSTALVTEVPATSESLNTISLSSNSTVISAASTEITPTVIATTKVNISEAISTTNQVKDTTKRKGIVTTVKPTTAAPKPRINCTSRHSCSQCSKDYHCYWCGPTEKCFTYPSGGIIPKGCAKNDWYWKQCVIPGYVLIIVVPSLAAFLLLLCGCCIYCKCCRQSNKSWKKEEERITQRRQERQMKAEERKTERKKKTDALRMKYGLLKSDDEEQLIS